MRTVLLLLFLFSAFFLPTEIVAWPAQVLHVYDGDTVTVAPAGDAENPIFVRLYGIDAPQLEQSGGKDARIWLAKAIPEKTMVEIIPMGFDAYGRVYGLLAKNGEILNRKLLEEGHAWVWSSHCRAMVCRSWKGVEKKAQEDGKGLWGAKNPVAPWMYGKGQLPLAPGGVQKPVTTVPEIPALPELGPMPQKRANDPSSWFELSPP